MPSDHVLQICNSSQTLTSAFAAASDQPVSKVSQELFKNHGQAFKENSISVEAQKDANELDRASLCGKFPYRPSDLFLKIYDDVLATLDTDPLAGLVSPPLLGSSGVIPLSIVSVIPDIMRHYADLIVRARSEVFIATNYWEKSHSARLITDSIYELSKRVTERKGEKVVVKLMYDRGSPKQVLRNHIQVKAEDWPKVGLPKPEDIPGVSLEVVNYHRPPLGTFHAKFLVIDRKVACLNSNNIQDRPNVEMMVHVEGPIVESFYDMALLSWSNAMNPPLPLLSDPPEYPNVYQFQKENDYLKYIDPDFSSKATREYLKKQHAINEEEEEAAATQDGNNVKPEDRVKRALGMDGEGGVDMSDSDKNEDAKQGQKLSNMNAPRNDENSAGYGTNDKYDEGRSHLISEHPNMKVPKDGSRAEVDHSDAQRELAEKDGGRGFAANHKGDNRGYEPFAADQGLDEQDMELAKAAREDDEGITHHQSHDRADLDPSTKLQAPSHSAVQSTRSTESEKFKTSQPSQSKAALIAEHLNAGKIELEANVDVDDEDDMVEFRPHILHQPHNPCPIAMVNRRPTGTPGHDHVHKVPQDVAWLGAMKYAKQSIFIQTPTFNASAIVPATLDACRRGVQVTLYLDLGFNDQGEMIPFQGGTNEEVVSGMYKALHSEGRDLHKNLRVYWYTGKDQRRPLSATMKKRNCHVKFMSIDDQVAILGNGNQDTQSWFHSQEINIMVDSRELVAEWLRGINANQNTYKYGLVSDEDGVWRDPKSGEIVEASGIKSAGFFGRMKGLGGAIARARGTGGF